MTSTSVDPSDLRVRNAETASAWRSVSSRSTSAKRPGRARRSVSACASSMASRKRSLNSGGYAYVAWGPRRTSCSPSVSMSATSMPSMDVPLMRPNARKCLPICTFPCMFARHRHRRMKVETPTPGALAHAHTQFRLH